MSAISLKSITGITSITTPAGVDNQLTLHTNNTTERLRINTIGQVGIGTDNPTAPLQINHASPKIILEDNDNGADVSIANIGGAAVYSSSSDVVFQTADTSEKLRIASDGNVIIGSGGSWSYPKALNVQGASGSILSLYNADTTSYAQDTNTSIELKLLTGNTGNQFGTLEIRGIKENGTNGNNARALTFYTGVNGGSNAERLRIDSDGNIWVNYGNPQSSSLIILDKDGSGEAAIRFYNAGANKAKVALDSNEQLTFDVNGDERLRITSDGSVILGATSTSNAEQFRIHTSDSGKAIIKLTNSTTGTGTGDGFEFGLNGNEQIEFFNKENTDMFFGTNNLERLRITSAGRIGIGTATPDSILALEGTGSDNATRITIKDGTGIAEVNGRYGNLILDSDRDNAVNGSVMTFQIDGSEKVRITSAGNVGINETNPTAKLDIVEATSTTAVKIKSGTSTNQNASLTFSNDNGGGLMHLGVFGSSASTYGSNEATDGFITAMQQLSLNSQNASGEIRFGVGVPPETKLRITSTGHVRQIWSDGAFMGTYYDSTYYMGFTYGATARTLYIDNRSNDTRADIVFRTGESTAATERLRITSAGKLGINETSPSNYGIHASQSSESVYYRADSGSVDSIYGSATALGYAIAGTTSNHPFVLFANNAERLRIGSDYITVFRENSSNEGGQIALARASDNSAYWFIDSYGSTSTPDFRLHAGGNAHFGINSSGQWTEAPTGTVIKVGYQRYDPNSDTYATIAQDTKARSAAYLDYTCQRTDSKLYIMTRMHTRMINAYGCSYGIDQSTDSGSSWSAVDGMATRSCMDFFYKGDAVNHHYTGFCMRQIDAYSGSRRFSPWGQGWANGTWEISYGHGEHSITIYEVAV